MWDGRETFKRPGVDRLHARFEPGVLRPAALRPRRPGQRRDAGPRAGRATAQREPAGCDRRLRDRPLHRAVLRRRGRIAERRRRATADRRASSTRLFYFGINDVVSGDFRTGAPFNATVFDLYDAWASLPLRPRPVAAPPSRIKTAETVRPTSRRASRDRARRGAVQHQAIRIAGVKGLNDELGIPVMHGTCTTCHDTPNVGNHSIPAPLDIGLADASRRTPDMPLYTLRNNADAGDDRADHRPGPRADHRQVGRHRPVQGADAARPRDARAVLPQRLRRLTWSRSSSSTTRASTSGSPPTRRTISLRSCWRCEVPSPNPSPTSWARDCFGAASRSAFARRFHRAPSPVCGRGLG